MTIFLIAVAAFCIGNYLGRKAGIEDGRQETYDEFAWKRIQNVDLNDYIKENWPGVSE